MQNTDIFIDPRQSVPFKEKLKKFTIPVLKIKSAAVDEQICVLFSTAARLLRRPQDAAQIAAPVRISPQ